jgi:hypothetical protein
MATRNLNTNSDGNNTGARQGPYSSGHALSQNRSTPDIPSTQRGVGGSFNVMLVDTMTIQVAGPAGAVSVRGRIWDSSGTAIARSGLVTAPSNSSFSIGNVTMDLTSSALLSGGTLYRWGVWSTGDIRAQTSANSSFNVYTDLSIGATDNWSTGNTSIHAFGSSFSLVGSFDYYLIPTPPSVISNGSTSSSISFSWSVADNGGKSISQYVVQYKPNFSGTWLDAFTTTSTSGSISGLSAGTTYDVRIAAKNAVSDLAGTTSDWGSTSIATSGDTFSFTPTFSFAPTPTTTVPNLNGLTATEATTALSNVNLSSSATNQPIGATVENNNFVVNNSQSPAAGTTVNTGSTVSYQVYQYIPPAQEVSIWNGTSWVTSTPKVWNGTSWVSPTAIKVWNGTSWVNPT